MYYLKKALKKYISGKYLFPVQVCLLFIGFYICKYTPILFSRIIIRINKSLFSLEPRAFLSIKDILSEKYCTVVFQENKDLFYRKQFFFDDCLACKTNKEQMIQVVLKLNNAKIFGASSIVLVGEIQSIYDLYALNNNANYNYTDSSVKYVRKNKFFQKNKYLTKNVRPKKIRTGILLSGNASRNYYHLTIEILSKLYYLKKLNINRDIPLLVDEICEKIPNYKELVLLFNDEKRKIIYIKDDEKYEVGNLYFAFAPSLVAPNFFDDQKIQDKDFLYDYDALNFVKEKMISVKSKKEFPKKIFLSRANASDRRIFNENEIFDTLKKHGFEKVFPENYSIQDQVAMFNGAEAIAGGGGAAFTNILYCKKQCKILCFTNYKIPISIFSTLADFSEANMVYFYDVTGNKGKNRCLQDGFYIDPQDVSSFMSGDLGLS